MNKDAAYIEETTEGGLSAYIGNQNARYQQALLSGDADLQSRLQADAARVGYALGNYTGGGGNTSGSQGTGRDNIITVIPQPGGGSYTLPNTGGNVNLLGQLGNMVNLGGDGLTYLMAGLSIIFMLKLLK